MRNFLVLGLLAITFFSCEENTLTNEVSNLESDKFIDEKSDREIYSIDKKDVVRPGTKPK